MVCPACLHENPTDSNFCLKCGVKLERTCPSCAKTLPPDAAFCNSCGHDLTQAAAHSETPLRALKSEPAVALGERRQATVLFSDLSGYTAMNEKLDPEEVEGIMSRIKVEAVRIVENHGGIVSQFVGDEVLALFGIPTAHEDDPRRAVKAALELHELAHNMSPEVEEKIGQPLRMHSGINSGLIVTSRRDQRDGTIGVTGDTVNTGARLKALAEDDQILVSPDTQRRIAPFFELEVLPPVAVKGKARPIVPYRVAGFSGIASRFDAAEERGFTSFTGRAQELNTLNEAMAQAAAGHGKFITVSGEAGSGKTRLLYEFRHSLNPERIAILQGRCQSEGIATPYLPLIDALRRGLGLRDGMAPAEFAEEAVAQLRAIDSALETHLPVLLHLLSITSGEHPLPETTRSEELRQASQEALAAIIMAQAERRPTLLLLEDWHWADEASDSALRYLLGLIGSHRLVIVVNYRPEYDTGWGSSVPHAHLTISPLNDHHSEIVAKSVLGAQHLPEGLGDLIHAHTGGNPFFIEEVCRDLLESGTLLVEDGQGALTRPAENLNLPPTVQAVIRTRLDRLDENHQEVIRLASVIGREFDHRLLAKSHGGEKDFSPLLENMKAQGLIHQVRIGPDAAYQFKHVLSQLVIYETLLFERRKALHDLVGMAMEELYAECLEEHYEQLAYHFRNSDRSEKAIQYLGLAGDKAAEYYSLEYAREFYRSATSLLDVMELTPAQKRDRVDLTVKWADVSYFSTGEQYFENLEAAKRLAEELDDKRRMAQVCCAVGRIGIFAGQTSVAKIEGQQALDIAEELADEEILTRAHNLIGRVCMYTGDWRKGILSLEKGCSMLEQHGDKKEAALSRSTLFRLYAWSGDFPRAKSIFEELLAGARSDNDPEAEARALIYHSSACVLKGGWEEAAKFAVEGSEIAGKIGNTLQTFSGLIFQGISAFMRGDREGGRELGTRGIEGFSSRGAYPVLILYAWMAEINVLAEKLPEARHLLDTVEEKMKATGQNSVAPTYKRVEAMAAARDNSRDWKKAEKTIQESLRIAEEQGARPDFAISKFRYSEILRDMGELPRARDQLDRTTPLFRDMEMTWWLEQAEELARSLAKA